MAPLRQAERLTAVKSRGGCVHGRSRGVAPEDALALERIGMDADAFDSCRCSYSGHLEYWDYWRLPDPPAAVEWALNQVSLGGACTYLDHDISLEEAASGGGPLIARTAMPDNRLRMYVQLGMTVEEATEHEVAVEAGENVEPALEMLLALRQGSQTPNEPPF